MNCGFISHCWGASQFWKAWILVSLSARPSPTWFLATLTNFFLCHCTVGILWPSHTEFSCSFPNEQCSLLLPYVAHVTTSVSSFLLSCFIWLVPILQDPAPAISSPRSVVSRVARWNRGSQLNLNIWALFILKKITHYLSESLLISLICIC